MNLLAWLPASETPSFGIMEDDRKRRKRIARILRGKGYRVRHVKDADEAVALAERKAVESFLLDIHMGERRQQEGLDALERIKNADESIFVAVYSAHSRSYREMAENLEADCFVEKTSDEEEDIQRVLEKFEERGGGSALDHPQHKIPMGAALKNDTNVAAFRKLLADEGEADRLRDHYVGFVNGELVGSSRDQGELLRLLRVQHPDAPRFVGRVTGRVVHVPTPLGVRPYTENL